MCSKVPALLFAIFAFAAIVHGQTFVQLSEDLISANLQRHGQFIYAKIQDTNRPAGSMIIPQISACTGVINVYVRACNTQSEDCSIESNFIPSPQKNDYSVIADPVSEFGQATLSTQLCGGSCLASRVYFLAISAAEPQLLTTNILVHLKYYVVASQQALPLFGMDRTLEFNGNDLISWKDASTCVKYDQQQGKCTEFKTLNEQSLDAVYKLYVTFPYVNNKTNANIGTLCGCEMFSHGATEEFTHDTSMRMSTEVLMDRGLKFPIVANDRVVVNVAVHSRANPALRTLYRPLWVYSKEPSGNAGLWATILLVLLALFLVCVAVCVLVAAIVLVLYCLKRNGTIRFADSEAVHIGEESQPIAQLQQ